MKRAMKTLAIASLTLLVGCLALASQDGAWPCSSSADCDPGQRCKLENHVTNARKCLDALACTFNEDCDEGFVCDDGTCFAGNCSANDAYVCGAYGCDAEQHRCRTECETPDDCHAPSDLCEAHVCHRPECYGSYPSSGCGGFRCKDGKCPKSCASSEDCDVGNACLRGRCVDAYAVGRYCRDDGDCPIGTCKGGTCYAGNLCAQRQCGPDQGYDCGTCSGDTHCDRDGKCAHNCAVGSCGMHGAIDCGACERDYRCVSGICTF
jgi:hypothetical protein